MRCVWSSRIFFHFKALKLTENSACIYVKLRYQLKSFDAFKSRNTMEIYIHMYLFYLWVCAFFLVVAVVVLIRSFLLSLWRETKKKQHHKYTHSQKKELFGLLCFLYIHIEHAENTKDHTCNLDYADSGTNIQHSTLYTFDRNSISLCGYLLLSPLSLSSLCSLTEENVRNLLLLLLLLR